MAEATWLLLCEFLIIPAHGPLFLFADLKSALLRYETEGDFSKMVEWRVSFVAANINVTTIKRGCRCLARDDAQVG